MSTKTIKDFRNDLKVVNEENIKARKDMVRFENQIQIKQEEYQRLEVKYYSMAHELEQRKHECRMMEKNIIQYKQFDDTQRNDLNQDFTLIKKFLVEPNIKKEFLDYLREKNKDVDKIHMFEYKKFEDQKKNVRPEMEMYAEKNRKEIMIKCTANKKNPDQPAILEFRSRFAYFRVDRHTEFANLKETACHFFNVESEISVLTDENGAQLPENENIDDYFRSHGVNNNQQTLILKYKEKKAMLPAKIRAMMGEKKKAPGEGDDDVAMKRSMKKEPNVYEEFFKFFPGIKDYIDVDKVLKGEEAPKLNSRRKKKRLFDDSHCCIFFWLLMVLITTLSMTNSQLNIVRVHLAGVFSQFLVGFESEILSIPGSYQTISNPEEVIEYINFLGPAIFREQQDDDKSTFLYQSNMFIGPLRIRQVKGTPINSCMEFQNYWAEGTTPPYTIRCHVTDFTSSDVSTDTLLDGSEPWMIYTPDSESGDTEEVNGLFGTYPPGGFIQDFQMDTSVVSDYTDFVNKILASPGNGEEPYFSDKTRLIMFQTILYNRNVDKFVDMKWGFENNVGGTTDSLERFFTYFDTNKYKDGYTEAGDNFRLFVISGLIIATVYMLVTDEEGKLSLNYLYPVTYFGFCNIAIIVFGIIAVDGNKSLKNLNLDNNSILETALSTNPYVNLEQARDYYSLSFRWDAIFILFVVLRLLGFLKISKYFYVIFVTLETAGLFLLKYFLTLIPIFIGFSIVANTVFGKDEIKFIDVSQSVILLVSLTIGYFPDGLFEKSDINLMAPFFTIYYFFMVFFLIAVFASIYIDIYRKIYMEYGEKFEGEDINYVRWFLSFVPWDYLKKRKTKKESQKAKKQLNMHKLSNATINKKGRQTSFDI